MRPVCPLALVAPSPELYRLPARPHHRRSCTWACRVSAPGRARAHRADPAQAALLRRTCDLAGAEQAGAVPPRRPARWGFPSSIILSRDRGRDRGGFYACCKSATHMAHSVRGGATVREWWCPGERGTDALPCALRFSPVDPSPPPPSSIPTNAAVPTPRSLAAGTPPAGPRMRAHCPPPGQTAAAPPHERIHRQARAETGAAGVMAGSERRATSACRGNGWTGGEGPGTGPSGTALPELGPDWSETGRRPRFA